VGKRGNHGTYIPKSLGILDLVLVRVVFADQASTVSTITFWNRLAKKIGAAAAEGGTDGRWGGVQDVRSWGF
jgi:hypothetical protein